MPKNLPYVSKKKVQSVQSSMRIHRQHVDKDIEEFEVQKISIKLANPFKTKAIAQAKIKTDKLDARVLAQLCRTDFVAECYVVSIRNPAKIGIFSGIEYD